MAWYPAMLAEDGVVVTGKRFGASSFATTMFEGAVPIVIRGPDAEFGQDATSRRAIAGSGLNSRSYQTFPRAATGSFPITLPPRTRTTSSSMFDTTQQWLGTIRHTVADRKADRLLADQTSVFLGKLGR